MARGWSRQQTTVRTRRPSRYTEDSPLWATAATSKTHDPDTMCGICGLVESDPRAPVDERLLRSMCSVLEHRGPDDEGLFVGQGVGIGARRLSIIDVEAGHQPMANENESVWAAQNGELYNFVDLRPELESKGHRFRTRCDTEVLVHLYEEHGDRLMDRLNGMFAFAVWDASDRKLLLARDRPGIKPLFYYHDAERLIFASEIKAILEHPAVPRELDLVGLHHYLTLHYAPAPYTCFKGIRKLPPGHALTVQDGRVDVFQYWDVEPSEDAPPDVEEQILDELRESVRRRLVSDVPLGIFLSGGIDSSTVATLAQQVSPECIKTFSIGFEERSFSELDYARAIAERIGSEHHEHVVRPHVADLLPKLVWHNDEPACDASMVPTYFLSQFAREHVTVALSGDGGDELFGGYETYAAHNVARLYRRLPAPARRLLRWGAHRLPVSSRKVSFDFKAKRFTDRAELDFGRAHILYNGLFSEDEKRRLYLPDVAGALRDADTFDTFSEWLSGDAQCRMRSYLHADFKRYLPDDILVKVDRMSMANSLEVRTPFLDHRVIELAARLPGEAHVRGTRKKCVLKRVVAGLIPPAILRRKKQGFSIPVYLWLRNELRPMVMDVLSPDGIRRQGVFDPGEVDRLVRDHMAGRKNNGFELWALLVFCLWWERFMEPR